MLRLQGSEYKTKAGEHGQDEAMNRETDRPVFPLAAASCIGVAPCTLFAPKSAP